MPSTAVSSPTVSPSAGATDFQPRAAALGALVALGTVTALWSLLLWAELLVARAGGATFCALSSPDSCARLWSGPFASAIHRFTGLPVAGWGLAWALAATVLPLIALVRAAEGRGRAAWLSATRLVAAAGVVAVFVLATAALEARSFCLGCLVTYALTFGYAAIALLGWKRLGLPRLQGAVARAVAGLVLAFLLLLYPGLATPQQGDASGRAALAGVGVSGAGRSSATASSATPSVPGDDAVSRFVASLSPRDRQTLADSLYIYRNGIALPPAPPRSLHGPVTAPLRITHFSDIRCGHCAELDDTLGELMREAPAGSFATEARQFPLDGECNPFIAQSTDPVRCLAARARICAEDRHGAAEYDSRLFARQASLTAADVLSLAAGVMPRGELEACIASPETARKLQSDIELAVRYELDGTPLVVLDGRRGTSFAPFLYAMILTGGSAEHPAFAALPPANPSAHLH